MQLNRRVVTFILYNNIYKNLNTKIPTDLNAISSKENDKIEITKGTS